VLNTLPQHDHRSCWLTGLAVLRCAAVVLLLCCCRQAEKLSYVGHRYVPKSLKIVDLHPLMRKLSGLPDDAQLLVFEEVKWDPQVMVTALEQSQVLGAPGINQLESGDIICFQQAPPPEVLQALQQRQQQQQAAAQGLAEDSMEVEEQQQQQQQAGGQLQQQQEQQQLTQQLSQQHLEQQQQLVQQQVLCGQLAGAEGGQVRFPLVVDYLSYTVNRRLVRQQGWLWGLRHWHLLLIVTVEPCTLYVSCIHVCQKLYVSHYSCDVLTGVAATCKCVFSTQRDTAVALALCHSAYPPCTTACCCCCCCVCVPCVSGDVQAA
jgi:hypothetical protein